MGVGKELADAEWISEVNSGGFSQEIEDSGV